MPAMTRSFGSAEPKPSLPYDLLTVNAKNPVVRFSHRRRMGVAVERASTIVPPAGRLLDYGCGRGQFLHDLRRLRPDVVAIGFDPTGRPAFPGLRYVTAINEVDSGSIDVITILETFEHLDESEIEDFLVAAKKMLVPGGHVLASVPIMRGPLVVLKELNRRRLLHRREHTNVELLRAAFAMAVERDANLKNTHKGFDHRALERRLSHDLLRCAQWYCPFPWLPWWANSQAFSLWKVG
jgi:2-polyprenyl-3-methyl-5-hydroxy-6-metoxy-1,4-benzoquinol methylase